MGCVSVGPLQASVAILGTAINGYLAYIELDIYKEQRASLDPLTDKNMLRGTTLHGFDQTIKGMHQSVYDSMNSVEILSSCCEDAKKVSASIVSQSMWNYADALEEMSGYQAGLKSALYSRATRIAGKAVARQAVVFHEDQSMEWESIHSKNALVAASASPHNPHNTLASVMNDLAQSTGDRMNTSASLFSSFTREAFRDLGYAWALHNRSEVGSVQVDETSQGQNLALGNNITNTDFDPSVQTGVNLQNTLTRSSIFGDNGVL